MRQKAWFYLSRGIVEYTSNYRYHGLVTAGSEDKVKPIIALTVAERTVSDSSGNSEDVLHTRTLQQMH